METQITDAKTTENPALEIYLDGEEIGGNCVRCLASVNPNEETDGWRDILNEKNPFSPPTRQEGRVMWRPIDG